MDEKNIPDVPKKMPIQVGNSNQFVRGVVKLDIPAIHVQVTVEDLGSGEKRVDKGIARGPIDSFFGHVVECRTANVYPKNPKGGTRTIEEEVLESYWLQYRQVFEIFGECKGLDQFLQRLWEDYRGDEGIEPDPIVGTRKPYRENFKNALKTRMREWKKNKNIG